MSDKDMHKAIFSALIETLDSSEVSEESNIHKILRSIYKLHGEQGGCYIPILRVFLVGAGRSKLVAQMFGMRLMHLGLEVHIVGDVLTPKIKSGDLLIAISNSGNTQSVVNVCAVVKNFKLKGSVQLLVITGNELSQLACMADTVVHIDCDKGLKREIMPLGTLFELSTLILLESVIGYIIQENEIDEASLSANHTNLE